MEQVSYTNNPPNLDAIFSALADPTRRAILSRLVAGQASVNEIAAPFEMSQPAVSRHLKVLERAGLIERDIDEAPPAAVSGGHETILLCEDEDIVREFAQQCLIEAGYFDDSLVLEKPLVALHAWGRDPDLNIRMPLLSGQTLTAVELQLKFLEKARAFDAQHGFTDIVADAEQIMALWDDTLTKLQSRSFESLRGRIDWIMKRALLEQALAEHPDWDWRSPELTYLDQMYSSIDPADGLFHSLDAAGLFEPVATEAEIARFVSNPPEYTRAWTRAMLLRAAGPDRVTKVDWDRIDLKSAGDCLRPAHIQLPDPLGATRSDTEAVFSACGDFTNLLDRLQDAGIIVGIDNPYSGGSAVSLLDGFRNH